jgi:hypothetical protein
MTRPNLVNPKNWTPFQPIPIIPTVSYEIPPPPPTPVPKIPLTRQELIKRNSQFLNFIGILVLVGISYFLYCLYVERKIFTDYISYVKENMPQEYIPIPF